MAIKLVVKCLQRVRLNITISLRKVGVLRSFSDFGNAYDKEFNTPTAYSAGIGIRWASPIGPIRLDVATGLSDDS